MKCGDQAVISPPLSLAPSLTFAAATTITPDTHPLPNTTAATTTATSALRRIVTRFLQQHSAQADETLERAALLPRAREDVLREHTVTLELLQDVLFQVGLQSAERPLRGHGARAALEVGVVPHPVVSGLHHL